MGRRTDALTLFHPAVAEWFRGSFEAPTPPQAEGWPAIARGESTLILAPTGSGKTLTAFLWCINRVMFDPLSSLVSGLTCCCNSGVASASFSSSFSVLFSFSRRFGSRRFWERYR